MFLNLDVRLDEIPVYEVNAPKNAPEAYCVVTPLPSIRSEGKYPAWSVKQRTDFQVMCVSNSPEAVRRLFDYVRARLTDWVPPTGSRSTPPLREQSVSPVLDVKEASTHRYSVTIVYTVRQNLKGGSNP